MDSKSLIKIIDEMSALEVIKERRFASEDLEKIRSRVLNDEFRIAVVGEFSSGKSTFINALLGRDILMHSTDETTAAITYIRNVSEKDKRIGTCYIEYNDGNVCEAPQNELAQYTTKQSNKNVAETVKSVTVFAHFLNTSHPIVVVDTPGLNGVADRHRDITLSEVKSAHACIYLLSLKGISNSDKDFIRLLMSYQSRFIFAQNFIDELHGEETAESKLDNDMAILREVIGEEINSYDIDICGVSSLMALNAKEPTYRNQFSIDNRELTEEDRKNLWERSHLDGLLDILHEMMNSGSYKQLVMSSAIRALQHICETLIPGMIIRQEMNESLRKADKGAWIIERAKQEIERKKDQRPKEREKLRIFAVKLKHDYADGLCKHTDSELHKLYDLVCGNIEKRIPDYDALDGFGMIYGKNHVKYYSDYASDIINTKILVDINDRMTGALELIYKESIQRAMEYTAKIAAGNDIKIEIGSGTTERVKMDDGNWRRRIEEERGRLKKQRERVAELDKKINRANSELSSSRGQLQQAEREKCQVLGDFDKLKTRLGAKPAVEEKRVSKTKTQKRGGLLGLLGFTKEVSWVDVVYDDSAQRSWLKEYKEIQAQQENQAKLYSAKINDLRERISSAQVEISKGKVQRDSAARDIEKLEQSIERTQEAWETAIKMNKREFCNSQKAKLKRLLNEQLFGITGQENVSERLKSYIESTMEAQLEPITAKVQKFYDENVDEQIKMLENIVAKKDNELTQIYRTDDHEIALLLEIQEDLNGGITNE